MEIFSRLLFLQFPLIDSPVKELATLNVLHDDVNLGFGRHDIIELNSLGVSHQTHNRYFAFNLLHHFDSLDLSFVHGFNGNDLAGIEDPNVVDLGERPLSRKAR